MSEQITIESYLSSLPKEARGVTCEAIDQPRLNEQGLIVFRHLKDLRPHTLREISAATGVSEPSASARIREIRAYLEGRPRKNDPPELRRTVYGAALRKKVAGVPGLFTYEIRLNNLVY